MCFYNYKSTLQEAKKDIICYKRVSFMADKDLIDNPGKGQTNGHEIKCTPLHQYNSFKYIMGRIHSNGTAEIRKHGNIFNRSDIGKVLMDDRVEGAAFHSYRRLQNLGQRGKSYYRTQPIGHYVQTILWVQCTIPKGALFYMNTYEYISNQLRIDHIILDEKVWFMDYQLQSFINDVVSHKNSKLKLIDLG